ncbi:hypothetical protein AB5I41_29285 [Sphingomonas sp. MMS24-JH45]
MLGGVLILPRSFILWTWLERRWRRMPATRCRRLRCSPSAACNSRPSTPRRPSHPRPRLCARRTVSRGAYALGARPVVVAGRHLVPPGDRGRLSLLDRLLASGAVP